MDSRMEGVSPGEPQPSPGPLGACCQLPCSQGLWARVPCTAGITLRALGNASWPRLVSEAVSVKLGFS